MSEISDMFKLVNAMELAKTARVGMELTYFDVIELLGELESLKDYIAELEEERVILKDQMREATNILIDKNLHIDSLYDEGYKLQQRIAELDAAQRWIPVSERLPEECTPVLTLSKDYDKPVTAFLDAGFWWSNVDWALNVTHWMPLPQPPEVK